MFLAALCAAIMQVLAKREHERSDRVVKGCVSDMAGHGGQSGKGPELPVPCEAWLRTKSIHQEVNARSEFICFLVYFSSLMQRHSRDMHHIPDGSRACTLVNIMFLRLSLHNQLRDPGRLVSRLLIERD
jgi:hypothetical protein